MNVRLLKELMKQSETECGFNTDKFAELIILACAELIDNKEMITAAQTYDEVFVAKYDTKELSAKQIREHFGVEELHKPIFASDANEAS